jgi:hypothetical protein
MLVPSEEGVPIPAAAHYIGILGGFVFGLAAVFMQHQVRYAKNIDLRKHYPARRPPLINRS